MFSRRLATEKRSLSFLGSCWMLLTLLLAHPCFADWTKTISCPAGRVYSDIRKDAGREEYCERILAGSLTVKDGPYSFWYSEGHPGAKGNNKDGRQVGTWKECDRFDHCKENKYDPIFPEEQQRPGFKPQIPVSYSDGKYVFDFASCRSTWITQTKGPQPISLNILGGDRYRCDIAYLPENSIERGDHTDYFCRVPFSVGVRKFDSINLLQEIPRSGLPQFCHPTYLHGEPLLIQDRKGFTVASTVDVECMRLQRAIGSQDLLMLRLNRYATDLVKQAMSQEGPLATFLSDNVGPIKGPVFVDDDSGSSMLRYTLSSNSGKARQQRQYIAANFPKVVCD